MKVSLDGLWKSEAGTLLVKLSGAEYTGVRGRGELVNITATARVITGDFEEEDLRCESELRKLRLVSVMPKHHNTVMVILFWWRRADLLYDIETVMSVDTPGGLHDRIKGMEESDFVIRFTFTSFGDEASDRYTMHRIR